MRRRFELGSAGRLGERLALWSSVKSPAFPEEDAISGSEQLTPSRPAAGESEPRKRRSSNGSLPECPGGLTLPPDILLHVNNVFCSVPESLCVGRALSSHSVQGHNLDENASEGSGKDNPGSGGYTSWRKCSLCLTADRLHLSEDVSPAPGEHTGDLDGDQCLLSMSIRLECIVDVSLSVSVFGSVVEGGDIGSPVEAPALMRKTKSRFSSVLKHVPQADLKTMLLDIGPKDFREQRSCARSVDHGSVGPWHKSAWAGTGTKESTGNSVSPSAASTVQQIETAKDQGRFCIEAVSGGMVDFSERSTFEGASCNPSAGIAESITMCQQDKGKHEHCLREGVDDWLSNGVAVGTFELPPIPLARLPETQPGLAEVRTLPGMEGVAPPRRFPNTYGGMPVGEYDDSNCRPHQHMCTSIPPLPPAGARLPQRTHRELRTQRANEVAELLGSSTLPCPHITIVWTTPNRSLARSSGHTRMLQQGSPILMAFHEQDDAIATRDTLLECRATQLEVCRNPQCVPILKPSG